jgi:hypothetical protein
MNSIENLKNLHSILSELYLRAGSSYDKNLLGQALNIIDGLEYDSPSASSDIKENVPLIIALIELFLLLAK